MAKIGLDRNVCYHTYFRRICMESAEHNGAYISPTICTNRLIFGNGALFFLNMLTNRMTLNFCDVTLLCSLFENQSLNAILVFQVPFIYFDYKLKSLRLKARNFGGSPLLDNI